MSNNDKSCRKVNPTKPLQLPYHTLFPHTPARARTYSTRRRTITPTAPKHNPANNTTTYGPISSRSMLFFLPTYPRKHRWSPPLILSREKCTYNRRTCDRISHLTPFATAAVLPVKSPNPVQSQPSLCHLSSNTNLNMRTKSQAGSSRPRL